MKRNPSVVFAMLAAATAAGVMSACSTVEAPAANPTSVSVEAETWRELGVGGIQMLNSCGSSLARVHRSLSSVDRAIEGLWRDEELEQVKDPMLTFRSTYRNYVAEGCEGEREEAANASTCALYKTDLNFAVTDMRDSFNRLANW